MSDEEWKVTTAYDDWGRTEYTVYWEGRTITGQIAEVDSGVWSARVGDVPLGNWFSEDAAVAAVKERMRTISRRQAE